MARLPNPFSRPPEAGASHRQDSGSLLSPSFVLMQDFSRPYRKVPYFGVGAGETADHYGKRDAMAVLADAAGCCFDDDVRQRPALVRALEYLLESPGPPYRVALTEAARHGMAGCGQ
jgi:hypothetical protein